ncbi:hypothetical protein GS532_22635 [Rhodococcus hoagii]|nr:hypothetical protein [Prescottella equi]
MVGPHRQERLRADRPRTTRRRSRVALAHRVSWELNFGPIADGMFVCHHCDNRRASTRDILFLGTPEDNSHDARDKGRLKLPGLFGEEAGTAVLTEAQVLEIRRRRHRGERLRSIAEDFG